MNKKISVGIIGLGGIAQIVHLPILSKMESVKLQALCEINNSRLEKIATKYNVKNKYTDYGLMLENEKLDALIIATPTDTHKQIALDAIKAGVHLLIEKPVAATLLEAEEILNSAKQKNIKVMVGMNLRFRPDTMLLKSVINNGEIGDPFYIRCGWIRQQSSQSDWFLKKDKSGGGVIIDLGISLLDLSLWLLNFQALRSVTVQTYFNNTKSVEDSAVGFIRLEGDSVINFEVSWSLHSERNSLNLAAYGTHGTVRLNPLKIFRRMGSFNIDYTPFSAKSNKNLFKKSYENELKHFVSVLKDDLFLNSTIDEAYYRMKLLNAIYKSAETHKEIYFEK